MDTMRHLSASLDRLMLSILKKALIYTRRLCQSEEQFNIVKRKGVFCYDYVTDNTKLEDTSPPSKEAFFSGLQNRPILDEDYERFCDTWRVFGFANLGEYADFVTSFRSSENSA
ncbi:unnamed protein product [Bemisia tabaci]|uniref:Uncharacterized protein n=1 Tax=Bemisia tabaci TaxID=7038 RepID=A0A9P0AQ38_BEMTA|nr:unnamed protein product [Bemisia tabaci]